MAKKSFDQKYSGKVISGKDAGSAGSFIPYGISTQSLCLDIAIGCPGIPGSRMTQIFGLDGTGKSTLVMHLLAECQAMGGKGFLFDTEDCYDYERAKKVGVNLDTLALGEPDTLEELHEMMKDYSSDWKEDHDPTKEPLLFAIDSASGILPQAAADMGAGDTKQPGLVARTWNSNIVTLLRIVCKENRATVVVVSQQYTAIGQRTFPGMPPPMIVKDGVGIRYRSSLRVEIKARLGKTDGKQEVDGQIIGFRNAFYTHKNKSAAPHRESDYILTFDKGIDQHRDLYEAAVDMEIMKQGGGGKHSGVLKKANKKRGKKAIEFDFKGKASWPEEVERLGGLRRVRKLLTMQAKKLGYLKDYGTAPETTDVDEEG